MAVRIASSTASRPFPPGPATAPPGPPGWPISAVTSAASAGQSPPFLPPAPAGGLGARPDRPGLADRLVDLHDLLAQRGELSVARQLRADLAELGGSELAGPGPAAGGAGPQPPRPVAGMTRLSTRAIRLTAAAVGGVDAARPEVPGRGKPREQLSPLPAPAPARDGSVISTPSGSLATSRLSRQPALFPAPYVSCRTPVAPGTARECRYPRLGCTSCGDCCPSGPPAVRVRC